MMCISKVWTCQEGVTPEFVKEHDCYETGWFSIYRFLMAVLFVEVRTLVSRSKLSLSWRCFPVLLARSIHFPLNHLIVGLRRRSFASTLATKVMSPPFDTKNEIWSQRKSSDPCRQNATCAALAIVFSTQRELGATSFECNAYVAIKE